MVLFSDVRPQLIIMKYIFVHFHVVSSLDDLGFIKRLISDIFELFSPNEEIDIFIFLLN